MKYALLILFCISQLFVYSQLDKIFIYNKNLATLNTDSIVYSQPSNTQVKEYFYYDNSGNLIEWETLKFEFGEWSYTTKYLYTFDPSNNLISEIRQVWSTDNQIWENHYKKEYSYDENNNIITFLYLDWDNNTWKNEEIFEYTYNDNNRLNTETYKYWDEVWINSYLLTFFYDNFGNMIQEIRYSWANDTWQNNVNYSYQFDENGNQTEYLWQFWIDEQWINYRKHTYTYDNQNNNLTHLFQEWDEVEWQNHTLWTFNYDATGNLISNVKQYWMSDSTWLNHIKIENTWNINNQKTSETTYSWASGQWWGGTKNTYSYTNEGNYSEIIRLQWNESNWENKYKVQYIYTEGLIESDIFDWDGSSWEESSLGGSFDIIYNDELLATRLFISLKLYYSETTGIGELMKLNYQNCLRVFPNPAGNTINLQPDEHISSKPIIVQFSNMYGDLLFSKQISLKKNKSSLLNTSELPEGVYILSLKGSFGSINKRIIISR